MANYMFILCPVDKKVRVVCPKCFKLGVVSDTCTTCHGIGTYSKTMHQYYVQDKPIRIENVDRDPKTGILRYWDSKCEFFYETVYPELNKYVPNVPHGIHLCHTDLEEARVECERVNRYLQEEAKNN